METLTPTQSAQKELFICMVLNAWDTENGKVSKLLDTLTDDQLMAETGHGRNRGVYLIGHLIAVSDRLLTLLGIGERLYPDFDKIFLTILLYQLRIEVNRFSLLHKLMQALLYVKILISRIFGFPVA